MRSMIEDATTSLSAEKGVVAVSFEFKKLVVGGGEYGRILESTSSSWSSFPNRSGNNRDAILKRSSTGIDAIVVASKAMINRVAMRRDDVAMLSARSTGDDDSVDEQQGVALEKEEEMEDDDCLRSSETSLRNLM